MPRKSTATPTARSASRTAASTADATKKSTKPREKNYYWADEDVKLLLDWWRENLEYTRKHALSEWRNRVKEEVFNAPEYAYLTVTKITHKHDGLVKDFKLAKRKYCDTTGGGKTAEDATLDGMCMGNR
jgi:hypothetical protein